MNKAWSFFWLVVAWCIGITILASLIQPYLGVIALIVSVGVLLYFGFKAYRMMSDRRTHF